MEVIPPSDTVAVNVSILLDDDVINEATEGFILILEVETTNADDARALQVGRNESLGSIKDDDSMHQ